MSDDRVGTVKWLEPISTVTFSSTRATTWAKLRRWAARSGFAIFDQACLSGGNFILYMLLARWLAPAEYGVFAVVFSVYLFLLSLHMGLIQEPLSVLGHVVYGDDISGYCTRVLRVHLLFSLALLLTITVAGVWFLEYSRDALAHEMGSSFLALALALPLLLLLWLARRMAYLLLLPYRAAVSALVYLGILLIGMVVMRAAQLVSIAVAFGIMAAASGIAGAGLLAKLPVPGASKGGVLEVLHRHLHFGKWLLAVALLGWLARDAYYVLAMGLVGPAEAGALRAAGNLVTPLEQTQTALSVMLLPWLSHLSSRGENRRLRRRAIQITLAFTLGAVFYFVGVWLASGHIVQFAYQGKYNEFTWMVPWLLLPQVFRALSIGALLYLMVKEKTREVFYAAIGAGTPTILVAVLTRWWGLDAVVAGLVLSGLASFIIAVTLYRRATLEPDAELSPSKLHRLTQA